MTEQEYLQNYDPGDYPRPSVTADVVLFTIGNDNRLNVLLIRRAGHPYQNRWSLPGGFLNAGQETVEQAAERELREETGVSNVPLSQLAVFSDPSRDPRMHVISVAFTALVPRGGIQPVGSDDAAEAQLFEITYDGEALSLRCGNVIISEQSLAFDHAAIIKQAIDKLRGDACREKSAFDLLKDKNSFTVYELQLAHEAILGRELTKSNFKRWFKAIYANRGLVETTGETSQEYSRRSAAKYRLLKLKN